MKRMLAQGLPYLIAVTMVLIAFAVRWALLPQLGWREPFALFYLAILISAWFGGAGPGMLALLLSIPLAVAYFIRPLGELEITYARDWAALLFFGVVGTVTCLVTSALRRARSDLREHRFWRTQANASIRDQRLLLQAVVDEVPAAIAYLDRDLVVQLHNRTFSDWFPGAAFADAPRFRDVLGEQYSVADDSALQRATSGRRVDYDRCFHLADNREHHVRVALHPHMPDGASVSGIVLQLVDETEAMQSRSRLVASERRFRSLVQGSTSIVLRLTALGQILDAEGLDQYLGEPAPDRLDQLGRFVHQEDRSLVAERWRDLTADSEVDEFGFRLYHGDSGAYRHVLLRIVAIRDETGTFLEWVGMIRDIHDRRQAEIRLQRQERDLRLVLNTTSARISYIHADGRIRWVNRMTERWAERSAAELVGRPIQDILGGEEGEWLAGQVQRASSGEPVEVEWSIVHPVLGLQWSRSTITPDRDTSGEISGYVLLCLDITQRRMMEEELRGSEAKYRALSEHVPHMVWIADGAGRPFYFNRRWQEYSGGTPDHPWLCFGHPDDVTSADEAWQAARDTGNDLVVEIRFHRVVDQSWRWHVVRAAALKDDDGSVSRWYGTCTDIDDQKRAQRILTQAARKTDEFLGMLSHELRNPLAAIGLAAGAMALPGTNEDQRRQSAETVVRQTSQMRRMVDDLLDTARVSHGKIDLRLQATDLQSMLQQIVEDFRPRLRDRDVELNLLPSRTATVAVVDPARIQQCVDNLITNAVRASRAGQEVTVALELGRTPDELMIVVRDQGHGIEPDLLEAVFEPFVQGAATTGRLGLGLALVRNIVAMHGGEVIADSAGPGRGTTVRIHLARSDEQPTVPTTTESPFRRARVLLIDDEQDNVNALKMFLEVLGHSVVTAYDGPTGLAIALAEELDVIVCDLGLPPPLNGYEVARQVREASDASVYLIAFSGYGRPDDLQRSKDAGFDIHIVKPATPQILERAIRQAVS